MAKELKKKLSAELQKNLLLVLQERFSTNSSRHKGISWETVEQKLKERQAPLWTLAEMERTGGEPDVIGDDK